MARDIDLVIFGATGFTGALTAQYVAAHAPAGLRWAIAGRSAGKLGAVRASLAPAAASGSGSLPEIVVADVTDPASLGTLAARTKVVATTVGPYLDHGEPLVAACAAAGTDYLDLTGEPEFADTMYVRHHATALASGARIVHACGFDSIPHDLGVLFAVRELGASGPVSARGVVRAGAALSGGTFHTALTQFSRVRQLCAAYLARRRVEPPPVRRSRALAGRPGRDPLLGYWLVPLPTIDPQIVARSGASLDGYGSEFSYRHFAGTKTLTYAAGGIAGVAGLAVAAQVPPLRAWLGTKVPQGTGPGEQRRAASWFTVDIVAEGDGRSVHARVSGGDPGYGETSKMLAEAAMCLALDANPVVAGSVTTAQAMGENLTARLIAAGMRFEILD